MLHIRTNPGFGSWKMSPVQSLHVGCISFLPQSKHLWVKWTALFNRLYSRCEARCDCDCLLITVRFVMDWQLVRGVPCLPPSAFWDTIQPVVQDLVTSNCIWNQHASRLILFMGFISYLISANRAHVSDYIYSKNTICLFFWNYAFTGSQFVVFWQCIAVKGHAWNLYRTNFTLSKTKGYLFLKNRFPGLYTDEETQTERRRRKIKQQQDFLWSTGKY